MNRDILNLCILLIFCVVILYCLLHKSKQIKGGSDPKVCRYYITSETSKYPEAKFKSEVKEILQEIPDITFVETAAPDAQIKIALVDRSALDKFHDKNAKVRYSITSYGSDYTIPTSMIDVENYTNGVDISKFNQADYKKYVIIHEVLHALGFDHVECLDNQKCNVMHQHTRGIPQTSTPNYRVTLPELKTMPRLPNHPYINMFTF
jgi:ssRNA-specific RNase YbeY (16S rRNA maturation enzyme)